MATTSIGSSGVTFPDATTLATAASIIPGVKGQAFTSNGTFTIPTGVTALKVTVQGGGANGGGANNGVASGGSAGATAIAYLTGLTSGNTLSVTVGGVAGNSSVASGTQSITTITANGNGGSASGGTINIQGGSGNAGFGDTISCSAFGFGGSGANSLFGAGGGITGGNFSNGNPATGYGSGGGGAAAIGSSTTYSGGAGKQGVVIFEW